VPYLSALEVCSRRGAIQIHIYLYLYLYWTRSDGVWCSVQPLYHGRRAGTTQIGPAAGRLLRGRQLRSALQTSRLCQPQHRQTGIQRVSARQAQVRPVFSLVVSDSRLQGGPKIGVVVGSSVIVLLQIFSRFWQWNNLENRLIFGKVKAYKTMVPIFLGYTVYLAHRLCAFLSFFRSLSQFVCFACNLFCAYSIVEFSCQYQRNHRPF